MTFRSPLRNQWDQFRPKLEPMQTLPGYDGAMARAMLRMMPALIEVVELERDKGTALADQAAALNAVMANIGLNILELGGSAKREQLQRLLRSLEAAIGVRIKQTSAIILPGWQ